MRGKTQKFPTMLALCLLAWDGFSQLVAVAQAAPAEVTAVAPATLDRVFGEAETAFGVANYSLGVSKLQELLELLGSRTDAPLELIYFNIGYGYLMATNGPEAVSAFADYLKRFPKGEYASRSHLGTGRALILQDGPEKKKLAMESLKIAAVDPKLRSEAGFSLAEVYSSLGRREEALVVLKSLMGSDVSSPSQTSAAVEVISLLADAGDKGDLTAYLDRLGNQAGVRDVMAWYARQLIGRGEEQLTNQNHEAALAIFRSVPPRHQILEIQRSSLESQRKVIKILETRVNLEKTRPLAQRSSASSFLDTLKPFLTTAEKALAEVETETYLDASVLIRRGRCLYLLDRYEEALVCFRTIRLKHAAAPDAKNAAFGEIVICNKLKNLSEIKVLGEAYLEKYPDAENAEQVATLTGEVLGQGENWPEVGTFYAKLIAKFPQSANLDRYNFYLAIAEFQQEKYTLSTPLFTKVTTDFPSSTLVEDAMFYLVRTNFQANLSQETGKSCREYLSKFPDGRFAGEVRYRLAFIDFSTTDPDQSDKVIRDLNSYLNLHPDDNAAGSMLCLLGDTYKRLTSDKPDEVAMWQQQALDAYKRAVLSESQDDVVQYALESATEILKAQKDWPAIAQLHSEFLKRKPDSPLALLSAMQIAKMSARQGKPAEAAEMLADALKARISNPNSEQVEFMIDELVKTLVPRKKQSEIDGAALEAQLSEILAKVITGNENPTSNARLYYAKAQLARMLKKPADADRYMTGIAKDNLKDPSVLSPALLASSGEVLTRLGDFDAAATMFKRLVERYKGGVFADAGPVGLGYIALAQNKPEEALKIFSDSMAQNPGFSRIKETTLGELQALVELGRFDEANTKGLGMIGDKTFRGEFAGKAYLALIKARRKQAESAPNPGVKVELLKQANLWCMKLEDSYRSTPEICAEGMWQGYEILTELGEAALAKAKLTKLAAEPKLANTARAKQAVEAAK